MVGLLPYDRQYQGLVDPVQFTLPVKGFYASFLYQWSEPKRVRIDPRLSIALIASGLFAPVLNPNTQIIQNYESRWHYAWSEPVRIKRGTHPAQMPFTTYSNVTPVFLPNNLSYRAWAEPLYPKRGLKIQLQQTLAWPPRLLPPANVFVTLSAFETGVDTLSAGISTANAAETARVSIKEIAAIRGSAMSVAEDTEGANASFQDDAFQNNAFQL